MAEKINETLKFSRDFFYLFLITELNEEKKKEKLIVTIIIDMINDLFVSHYGHLSKRK